MCDDLDEDYEEEIDEPPVMQEGVTYYKNKIKDLVTNLANLAKFVKTKSRRKKKIKEGEKNYILSFEFDIRTLHNYFKIIQNCILNYLINSHKNNRRRYNTDKKFKS